MSCTTPEPPSPCAPASDQPAEPRRSRAWVGALALAGLTLAAYWPGLANELLNWDDNTYILENPHLQATDGLGRIWCTLESPQYYPLTFTAYWLQYQLWSTNPAGYHAVNLALHLIDSLLVMLLFLRLGARMPAAWIAAALFALHPVQVASVVWTAELKNVLSTFFYLTAILLHLRWRHHGGLLGYVGALVMFACALLSKTATLTLPLSLLLLDWLVLRIPARRLPLPLIPYVLLAIGAASITILDEGEGFSAPLALSLRPLVAAAAFWFYLGKLLWPADLLPIYTRWQVAGFWWPGWLAIVACLFAVGVVLLARKKLCRLTLWGGAHFIVSLVPILGLVPFGYLEKSFVADHFLYVASIGIFLIAGLTLDRLGQALRRSPVGRVAAASALITILLALGTKTWFQTKVWSSSERLWNCTLADNPNCWTAHNNLGMVHTRRGEIADAVERYRQALQIHPAYAEALTNLGGVLALHGDRFEAERCLRLALQYQPDYVQAHNNLANLLAAQRRFDDAVRHYRHAIELSPRFLRARCNLARALESKGDLPAAADEYRKALDIAPNYFDAWLELGDVLRHLDQTQPAQEAYRAAIETRPNDHRPYDRLAVIHKTSSAWQQAIDVLRQGLAAVDRKAGLQAALARLLAACPDPNLRNGPEALRLATAACKTTASGMPTALDALAMAHAELGDYEAAVQVARQARELARSKKYPKLTADIEGRIKLYEAGRPYREAATPPNP